MPILPAPPVHCLLTDADVVTLDETMLDAMTTGHRVCASCGSSALGLESAAANFRPRPREAGINDRAQNLSPIASMLSTHPDGRVILCNTCRLADPDKRKRLSDFTPDMSPEYAQALARVPFQTLQQTSFVDVKYKLTTHAYGYVMGEFDKHSLVAAPLLAPAPHADAPGHAADMALVKEYLGTHNMLMHDYTPLMYREPAAPLEVPLEAWRHIVAAAQARDPCTERADEHAHNCAALDVAGAPMAGLDGLDAAVGNVLPAMAAAPVPAVSSKVDVSYKTLHAKVDGETESIEQLLMPAFFPHQTGSYRRRPGCRVSVGQYLRHRSRQSFSPFTKHTGTLLLMRSVENTLNAINDVGHSMSEAAYKRVAEDLGPNASTHDIMKRLVKTRVSENVDGSPAMFKRAKRDLDTAVRELGLPSHFITITMNESGENCAVEYDAVDAFMKQWDASFDWRDAPIECNRAFVMRFEHVFKNHIMGGPKVLGDVQDYAIRYECQARGSLHVHMCIWLASDADIAALDNRICAFVPAAYDDAAHAFVPPEDALMHRLFVLTTKKQKHECYRANGEARPCMKDGHCSRKFPQPLHPHTQPELREDCCRYNCKYACHRECDRNTVPYVPDLALLFDAHVNIAKVVAEEWSAYLCKYTTKTNPSGSLRLSDDVLLRLGFADADVYARAIATHFAQTQVYQPAQLALTATDTPTFALSRPVVFANILPSARRKTTMRRNQHGTPRLDDMEAYEQRPSYVMRNTVMRNMCPTAFHRHIVVLGKGRVQNMKGKFSEALWGQAQLHWNTPHGQQHADELCPVADGDARERFIGVCPAGVAYFWHPPGTLVTFPYIDPLKDLDTFAWLVICEHVAFDSESQFTDLFPSYRRAAYELGLFDTCEKLQEHIARHCKFRFASAAVTMEQVLELNEQLHAPGAAIAPAPQLAELDAQRAQTLHLEATQALPADLELDASQAAAVASLVDPATRGICIVDGGAGVGKSVVARVLTRDSALADGVVLMAPTHETAALLSPHADTLHATFQLRPYGSTHPAFDCTHRHARSLATCNTLICDEFSIVNRAAFECGLTRIAHAKGITIDAMLARTRIALFGDEFQAPPVCTNACDRWAGVCPRHHIAGSPYFRAAYNSARHHRLTVNHRSPGMAQILQHIRNQHEEPLTQEWVDATLNDPCFTTDPVPHATRVLNTHHTQVDARNTHVLDAQPQPVQATPPYIRTRANLLGAPFQTATMQQLRPLERDWVARHKNNKLTGVAIGSRVRFFAAGRSNSCQKNAAAGTVEAFQYDASDWLQAIDVRMDRGNELTSVRRMPPVGEFVERYINVAFWPLALAHATTTHSVQGHTIHGKVHFDPQELFEPGLGYVGVSRGRELGDLTLGKRLTPHDLRVVNLQEFWARYDAGLPPDPKRRRTQTQ